MPRKSPQRSDGLRQALATLESRPDDRPALLSATRELGRISGYVETIMAALEDHLDGRKLAGVKRRLEHLKPFDLEAAIAELRRLPARAAADLGRGLFPGARRCAARLRRMTLRSE